jgi:hypothetical protein
VNARTNFAHANKHQQTLLEPYYLGQTLFIHNKRSFSKGERTNKLCSCKQTPTNFAGAILPWSNFVHPQQTKFFQGRTHEQTLLMQTNANKLCWSHIALANLCSYKSNLVFPPENTRANIDNWGHFLMAKLGSYRV